MCRRRWGNLARDTTAQYRAVRPPRLRPPHPPRPVLRLACRRGGVRAETTRPGVPGLLPRGRTRPPDARRRPRRPRCDPSSPGGRPRAGRLGLRLPSAPRRRPPQAGRRRPVLAASAHGSAAGQGPQEPQRTPEDRRHPEEAAGHRAGQPAGRSPVSPPPAKPRAGPLTASWTGTHGGRSPVLPWPRRWRPPPAADPPNAPGTLRRAPKPGPASRPRRPA